LLEEK